MRRFGFGVLGAIAGYVAFAFAGYGLIELLSSNVHDRSLEAAMTSAFVAGPLGALVGLVAGIVLGGRKPAGAR
jgi:hypothetical protein